MGDEHRGGEKPQESNGSWMDATLQSRVRTPEGHKALRARSARSSERCWRNVERVSPRDERGRVLREGNALEGKNPKSGSGTKQGRGVVEDQTLKGLRKAEEGRRPGWNPGNGADSAALTAEGAENPKGGAQKVVTASAPRADGRYSNGSL
jgi:hypothetical protein